MRLLKTYRIGNCLVTSAENIIQQDGLEPCTIQPKILEILNYLVLEHPRVISREELIDRVWDGNYYVGEKALTNAVWNLRRHLKGSGNEEVVATIRKRGYKLLIQPEIIEDSELNASEPNSLQTKSLFSFKIFSSILIAIFAIYWVGSLLVSNNNDIAIFSSKVTSITSEPGEELFASISPDGRYITYQQTNMLTNSNLFSKDLDNLNLLPKQLTFDQENEGHSVWSPDQKYLFFSRQSTDNCDYIQLDIKNSLAKKIAECPMTTIYNYLDISPDGKTFAFLGFDKKTNKNGIYFLDLSQPSQEPKRLSCNVECSYQDKDMAFSPDGKYLAVSRRFNTYSEDIYIYDFASEKYSPLTQGEEDVIGFTWHADSVHLAYGIRNSDIRSGYYVDVLTLEKFPLNKVGFSYPTFNKVDNSLFYQQRVATYQINKLSVDQSITSLPQPILKSEFRFKNPDYSEITKKITYVSNESNAYELWISDTDGQNREKLTDLNEIIRFPRWSHDSKKIAFLASIKNVKGSKIYILDVVSKQITKLDTIYNDHDRPTWSYDDQAIISSVKIQGKAELYLFPLSLAEPTPLTNDGAVYGVMPSPNTLFYTNNEYGLLKKDLLTNTNVMIVPDHVFYKYYSWTYTSTGVFYRYNRYNYQEIRFYNFDTKTVNTLAKFPVTAFADGGTLTFDPYNKELIYSSRDHAQSDLMKLTHSMFNN
jgi:Tol biopolymer transport system component/DNA-binding winged helix-turn-helix (wHTH) protein